MQSSPHHFARVLVAPGLNLSRDEAIEMIRQINVTRWHFGPPPITILPSLLELAMIDNHIGVSPAIE
jgi:hypothetical protein